MADDRSLKDVIRFLDPSGDMSDADIATIAQDLKFTEVLDLITYVGKDDLDAARNILSKHDERFLIAREYSSVPATPKTKSMFKPIAPSVTKSSSSATTQGSEDASIDDIVNDPANKNKPEVRQIQSLLQRMKR
jgi:hypothetical protein